MTGLRDGRTPHVVKTVDNAPICVETRHERIEEAPIRPFVLPERGPSHEVSKLDDTGRFRIDEQGHFGKVAKLTPLRTIYSEASGKGL